MLVAWKAAQQPRKEPDDHDDPGVGAVGKATVSLGTATYAG